MGKPYVFNYADFVKLHGECVRLKAENARLKAEIDALKDSCVNWHKISTRPLTDEEIDYYNEIGLDAEEIYDCEMPEDGQEILIATKWGVDKDICCNDDYGIGLEGREDFDGVFAWAEMPKYKEEE